MADKKKNPTPAATGCEVQDKSFKNHNSIATSFLTIIRSTKTRMPFQVPEVAK